MSTTIEKVAKTLKLSEKERRIRERIKDLYMQSYERHGRSNHIQD
jgi:hypothetical protein